MILIDTQFFGGRGGSSGGKGSAKAGGGVQYPAQQPTPTLTQKYNSALAEVQTRGFESTQGLRDYIETYKAYNGNFKIEIANGFSKGESIITGKTSEISNFVKHLKGEANVMVTDWGRADANGIKKMFVSHTRNANGETKTTTKRKKKNT